MALHHSQVYEAFANIRGGMSIYRHILAYYVPERQVTPGKNHIHMILKKIIIFNRVYPLIWLSPETNRTEWHPSPFRDR